MIVASGNAALDLDLNRLAGIDSRKPESKLETFRFEVGSDAFFSILVFNHVLRGPEQGSMGLIWGNSAILPEPLGAFSNQLVLEKASSSEPFDLVVRDGKTGLIVFNIEGHLYDYDAGSHMLSIKGGRLLMSTEFASKLGRPADAGLVVGEISVGATMAPIEITTVVNGAARSSTMPPRGGRAQGAPQGSVPGPDVIVGDLPSLQQFGSASGSQVGLAVGTTSCNNGDVELDWFALPSVDHPVIPQNLYRLSGKFDLLTFEQIGQSWLKHAFTALQDNACGFGCTPAADGTHLGVGCSDPYDAGLNATQNGLGSRAWVNPFTGAYPSNAASHSGHTHTSTTHRILVQASDLTKPFAAYYAEAQYVTPHEYAWCQTHPGQCNMYNNASYRQFSVTGTTNFTFSPVGPTVRMAPALTAWPGATINPIEPAPGVDGRAYIAYRVVVGFDPGTWHYEYAILNQNLDRGIQSFSVPLGCGIALSGVGFHAPLNHPGIANDGTTGSTGFSNAAWTTNQTFDAVSWSSETFLLNANANALRWGTLYNFRFDSNRPPQAANATIGFFKTGTPITVGIQAPSPDCTGTPTPTPTPGGSPSPTPTAAPTPTATPTPPCFGTFFSENFDEVTAPALPAGWVATNAEGDAPLWVTSNTLPDSAPNAAFVNDPDTISDKYLDTPPIVIASTSAQLTFRHNYDLESSYDGGVIEISIGGGPFLDLIASVGSFVDGGYNGTIDENFSSPIAGRQAWTDNSGGYITTVVGLQTKLQGQSVVFRFRMASDESKSATGWHVDNVALRFLQPCQSPTPTLTPTATPTPTSTPKPTPTATPTPAAQALNLSTRMRVETGDNIGIGGFIVTGTAPKQVLIRALGPSLAQTGVPNVLADPVLELHGPPGFVTIINDNWQDPGGIIGIPPPLDILESQILATLDPGAYTAIVRGNGNTPAERSGVALIEIYDVSQGVASKLANLSTRALVGTGNDVVIAGFILGNSSGDDRIVLRGIGPSLTALGVPNALADPTLELRDSNGVLLAYNNNWQDNGIPLPPGLAPGNPLESAIAATLPPGLYTALLAGLNNGTGVGLVEVYDSVAP